MPPFWRVSQPIRPRSLIAPGLVFLLMMSLTIVLRETSLSMISFDREQAIEARSGRIADLLLNQLQLRMRTLDTLANFLTAQPDVEEENFRKFSRQGMLQTTGFTAIAVTDLNLKRARWMETSPDPPPDPPPPAVLLDLINGEDIRRVALLFLDSGGAGMDFLGLTNRPFTPGVESQPAPPREFALTDPIQFGGFGPGFASLVPFYDDEDEDDPRGFVIGFFLYEPLARQLLEGFQADSFPDSFLENVQLIPWDMNTDLAVYAPDPVSESSSTALGLAQAAEQERFLGTQKWKVIVPPPDSLPTAPAYFTSSMILAMGTFLSLLIGGLLFRQQVVAEKSQSEALHSRTKLASTSDNLVRVKEELDLILNNVDEAIILYDENLSPLQANAAFQKAFSPVGNSVFWLRGAEEHHRQMLRHFQNESQYRALLNNLRENPEKPFSDELEGRRTEQDETPTYYQRWATAVCNADGSRRGYLLVYQDLTHTRAVERLKEDFLSNVTHDLRTPLAAIKGFAQTMLRSSDMDSATRMEFTNIICDESTRLQNLIDDLLDLRRMEDGQSDLSPSTYDMHALIDEVVRSSKAMLDPYDVTIDVQWDGKSHKSLLGDAAMIGRALRNILSNAVKHSPDHGTIWIKAVEGEDRIELEFTDEGLGIPSEDLPHVFEKFYRGARRLRGTQGTGLGLAIVKHIIESHGGVVSASNAAPRGACIKIVLPREVDPGFGHLAETAQSRGQAVSI